MGKYAFILGHNPTLSVWEIVSVLNQRGIDFKLLELSGDVFCVQTDQAIGPAFLDRLGGTISIVEVVKEISRQDLAPGIFLSFFKKPGKIIFGFSVYKLEEGVSRKTLRDLARQVGRLGLGIKRELKNLARSARFITGKDLALSSISVESNKLLEESGEWVFLAGQNKILLGRAIAVQKSSWYSWRDYGRPARDARAGMLPPKLAKILINLSGVEPGSGGIILDPFCGSGTVIQEAGILGFDRLIGSDREPKAIEDSRKNWQWLIKNGLVAETNLKSVDFKLADARHVSSLVAPGSVAAVVTEGYLGPAGQVSPRSVEGLLEDLSNLYLESFQEFKKILAPSGRVVITMPVYRFRDVEYNLPITREIRSLGFKSYLALPSLAKSFGILEVTGRGSVLYGRPDQRVWREVFVFKK